MDDYLPQPTANESNVASLAERLNEVLRLCPDQAWNYSRINLVVRPLSNVVGPYVLRCEIINSKDANGRAEMKSIEAEIKWGERHGNELGILELVSLRLNRVLFELCDRQAWDGAQPVLRVVKKETLNIESLTMALWYEVEEVSGEEFESR